MIVHAMTDPLDQDNIREYLTAFADGELDATQILAVLDYIRAQPETLDLIMQQQKLRVAALRTIRATAPPVPAALCERIAALAAAESIEPEPARAAVAATRWTRPPWLASVAALLFLVIGLGIGFAVLGPWGGASEKNVAAAPQPYDVPPTTVAAVTAVHVDCSRFAAHRHDGRIRKDLGELSAAIKQDFSGEAPYPDLSAMGYKLVGAGPCRKPLEGTVHLLYRSTVKDVNDTLSIFVQSIDAQTKLEPGRFYLVSDPASAHPMFAWRTARAAYFLVGDEMETTERARGALAVLAKL